MKTEPLAGLRFRRYLSGLQGPGKSLSCLSSFHVHKTGQMMGLSAKLACVSGDLWGGGVIGLTQPQFYHLLQAKGGKTRKLSNSNPHSSLGLAT